MNACNNLLKKKIFSNLNSSLANRESECTPIGSVQRSELRSLAQNKIYCLVH